MTDNLKLVNSNLENKIFYRFIKVSYFLLLAVIFLIVAGFYFLVFSSSQIEIAPILRVTIFGFIAYLILNFTKESILYIAYGKKITWHWINFNFKKILTHTDPAKVSVPMLAQFPVHRFFNKESPFVGWKPEYLNIPEDLNALVFCVTAGYVFYNYLELIQHKYGKEMCSIAREYTLTAMNRFENSGELLILIEKALDFSKTETEECSVKLHSVEDYIALYCLVNMQGKFYIANHENKKSLQDLIKLLDDNEVKRAVFLVSKSLVLSKQCTLEVFSPFFRKIYLSADSISGIHFQVNLMWSSSPGHSERTAQRIYSNPLIKMAKPINQEQIDILRLDDIKNARSLLEEIEKSYAFLCEEFNSVSELNKKREVVDDFINRCYQVGGDAISAVWPLTSLRKLIIETSKMMVSHDNALLTMLENAEEHHRLNVAKFNNEFIMHLTNKNSPLNNYLDALILFEDLETLVAVLDVINDKSLISTLIEKIYAQVEQAKIKNITIPLLDQKLLILSKLSINN